MTVTRRSFVKTSLALLAGGGLSPRIAGSEEQPFSGTQGRRIPVILDSDIGDDIDDTWALLMLLRSPQFDVKLVVSDFGNAIYRCRLFAKLLELTGHTHIPVGVGLDPDDEAGLQSEWIGDYRLEDYPGKVYHDGVQALIDTVTQSPDPVTLLCIGPVPNIAEALRREPAIAANARFVGMHGSIYAGYDGAPRPSAEWNVKSNPKALQQVFAAPWDCTITPLDTCGSVRLTGENYQRIYRSGDPWLKALVENYRVWLPLAPFIKPGTDPSLMSTILFDTVAVYAAHTQDLLIMEDLPLRVTDDGYTVIDSQNGRLVHCAVKWKDFQAFKDKLVDTLTNGSYGLPAETSDAMYASTQVSTGPALCGKRFLREVLYSVSVF